MMYQLLKTKELDQRLQTLEHRERELLEARSWTLQQMQQRYNSLEISNPVKDL